MIIRAGLLAACLALLVGCNDKHEEYEKQVAAAKQEQVSTKQLLGERDKYIEDVMQAVNDVYREIETARVKEGRLVKRSGDPEVGPKGRDLDTFHKLLTDIDDIGSVLKENRKRIDDLQYRMGRSNHHIASLDTLVANLRTTILEREGSIAQLEVKVQGLEQTLAEKTRMIDDRDLTIVDQRREMNRGLYVVGTRDELKKKGIIVDEGGFLWGLLGSTTVMAGAVDPAEFTSLDRLRDTTIHVPGTIAEILPRRGEALFSMKQREDNSSELNIASPDGFWQNKYLVIVVN